MKLINALLSLVIFTCPLFSGEADYQKLRDELKKKLPAGTDIVIEHGFAFVRWEKPLLIHQNILNANRPEKPEDSGPEKVHEGMRITIVPNLNDDEVYLTKSRYYNLLIEVEKWREFFNDNPKLLHGKDLAWGGPDQWSKFIDDSSPQFQEEKKKYNEFYEKNYKPIMRAYERLPEYKINDISFKIDFMFGWATPIVDESRDRVMAVFGRITDNIYKYK